MENWRLLLADSLFDKNIPESLCIPISEWLWTSVQGAICTTELHNDETFLENIKPCIQFITMSDKDTLYKIFTKAEENNAVMY